MLYNLHNFYLLNTVKYYIWREVLLNARFLKHTRGTLTRVEVKKTKLVYNWCELESLSSLYLL